MGIQLKNNAVGYLNSAISASDPSFVLQSGNGALFPVLGAGDYFYATLQNTGNVTEIIKVTARTGDAFTVLRGQEGTVAQSFASNSRVELRVTAQSVFDAVGDVVASQVGFTPTGGIAATDVQAAIVEVVSDLATSGGAATVGFLQSGTGAVTTTVQRKLRESVSVFDFMTSAEITDVQAGSLSLNVAPAIVAALASGAKRILFPGGKYRCDSTITITGARGLTLEGDASAILAGGTGYSGNTELVFDTAVSGTDGLVLTDFVGVTLENILIRMRRGGAGGGKALYMYTGHDYSLRNVNVDLDTGASGAGIVLGNGNGATATFAGEIQNCKVIVNAACPGIYANFGTSLTFTACYVIGGWMRFDGMTYFTVNSCAVDASRLYGYIINGSTNGVFNACGAEGSSKGVFYLSTTASNIVLNAPYGADNNTSADANIGDLVHLDSSVGAVNSITITNPTSAAVNAATLQNIWASAGTGFVEVYNTDLTLFTKGFGGNATWIRDKLTVTGVWDLMTSWTPTLVGWTNVGSPTVVGKYKRVGKIVTFYVTITPATSISCTRSASTITGFPWSSIEAGSATMTDGNVNSYGACVVGPTGIIYPQTSGVLTTQINLVGTVILT